LKYAAFFRNLNLGRPNCPSKTQFEMAFVQAGARSAASFLTNGTLVFSVAPGGRARQVLAGACAVLRNSCGLKEPAYIRPVGYLSQLVATRPFAAIEPGSVYACCVSFLHPEHDEAQALPPRSPRGDVRVLQGTGSEVLSVSLKIGNTPGSPNAFLEKLLGRPATTRNWSTVERLVAQHSDGAS
jgi:uncharacterized protein (DUF1697 family)